MALCYEGDVSLAASPRREQPAANRPQYALYKGRLVISVATMSPEGCQGHCGRTHHVFQSVHLACDSFASAMLTKPIAVVLAVDYYVASALAAYVSLRLSYLWRFIYFCRLPS